MKANPGGQIDLRQVVGRDEIIGQIWETLDQQSIRMNAERRIGKTTIVRKLQAEPRPGWVPIYQDLEQYHSADDFAVAVYREVDRFLSKRKRTARRVKSFLESIGGIEVAGVVKLPDISEKESWKEILTFSIQDLVQEREDEDERPLFLWDEVPFMLASIKDRAGESVAMEILDTLRALRQTFGADGLRMILTGSIGLHHVIQSLKRHGYANSPLNDVYPLEVPPLDVDAARELAARLIAGEALKVESAEKTAEKIADLSDGFPFYIHHIVKALKRIRSPVTPDSVEAVVLEQLLASHDPWELNHYRTRVPIYYGERDAHAVLAMLDGVAARSDPVPIDDLLAEVKSVGALDDREKLIELVKLVAQDHYLTRNASGHYHFQFPLLRRWWKLSRGL